VIEGMVNSTTQAVPTTSAPQATLGVFATTSNVVQLVRPVKSMREMGCELYIGEQDAEIAKRWIKKLEKTIIHINIPEDLRVNCATQLLSTWAMTW